MEYFLLNKTDKLTKTEEPIVLNGGYKFAKKTSITLYNKELTDYILTKKINKKLRDIIELYLSYINEDEGESDDDTRAVLEAKLELLKRVLFENYAPFLSKDVAESYIIKLEKMEEKIGNIPSKKRTI